ncbi:hypothetical protein M2323_004570 [Rhodoblastus acidophilus]|uniref:sulfur globule protein precursor n=1 Tax=Rhodoblastus acidophilus TaxID=1074 RepID=UPI0022243EB3|nr:sulfur globule protein precursor [Rhodoblastus acidophilus]MCW2286788.1 hypothetical protein [Rhodoblastus acidophilus]MCW2335619.1 hypothetical protein [Rhodoblastus acidophilus]
MSNLRNIVLAAGLSLFAAGAVLSPTGALAWGPHGGGHWGGHGGWGHHGGWHHGGWGHRWGYGPRFVYGGVYGGCFLKRYVNDWGEIVVRRVCY